MKENKGVTDVVTVSLICAILVLVVLVAVLGWCFFTDMELKNKDIAIWFIFMLFAAGISCIFNAINFHVAQKSEENKEKNMTGQINNVLEKTEEIKEEVITALEQSDLVSGDQENILKMLMYHCLDEEIREIRIFAHHSESFSGFFTDNFKDKPFKCEKLRILIHDPAIKKGDKIINEWDSLFKNKDIYSIQIRKAKINRRSFFGMIIDLEGYGYPIGLIGFYEPQGANGDQVTPFKERYGVFNKRTSILEVLNENFNYYFNNVDANSILEKNKKKSEN